MCRCIAICAGIVHVNVHVSTHPRRAGTVHLDGHQSNHDLRLLTRYHVYASFLELKLEAAHNSHMHRPCWNCNFGHSLGIEIVRLKPTFAAVETIIAVHPSVVWPMRPTVL